MNCTTHIFWFIAASNQVHDRNMTVLSFLGTYDTNIVSWIRRDYCIAPDFSANRKGGNGWLFLFAVSTSNHFFLSTPLWTSKTHDPKNVDIWHQTNFVLESSNIFSYIWKHFVTVKLYVLFFSYIPCSMSWILYSIIRVFLIDSVVFVANSIIYIYY